VIAHIKGRNRGHPLQWPTLKQPLHNYYLKRADGTTAAERFYENRPIDMFEWLLGNMAQLPRPRSKTKIAA